MNTHIIQPPAPLDPARGQRSVFLAGSIDMGTAGDWQAEYSEQLADDDTWVLNPRRNEWDASWEQSIDNPLFRGQVEWELEGQEIASVIAMFFEPTTRAPITLMELGLFARSGKVLVCCPRGYWRRGNVEIVCRRYDVPFFSSQDEFVAEIHRRLEIVSRKDHA